MTVDRTTTGDTGAETVEESPAPERRPPPDTPGAGGAPSRADSRAGAAAANDTAGNQKDAKPGQDKPETAPPAEESSSEQENPGVVENESGPPGPADAASEQANEQSDNANAPDAQSAEAEMRNDTDAGERGQVAEEQAASAESTDMAGTGTDGAPSVEDAREPVTGQAQGDAGVVDPAEDAEVTGIGASDEDVTGPAETTPDESETPREAVDLSRKARRDVSDDASEEEKSADDPAEIAVPVRAGRKDRDEREETSGGSSSTDQRSAAGESRESGPAGSADQRDDASHDGADTGPSAADATPVIGEDRSWDWKGVRLEPEENHIADLAHAERRIAEGRDEAGNYGDHGITPAMRRIEGDLEHGELVGCPEFSLKSEDRFKEKLAKKISDSPALSAREVAARIHDGIRYTFIFEPERYPDGVRQIRGRLEEAGYSLEFQRPTWDDPEYKGMNSRWRDAESGQLFEVQFHTPQSWDAKQKTHDAYEKMAPPTTPPQEIARLQEYQREVTASVVIPPGALEIPYYEKEE